MTFAECPSSCKGQGSVIFTEQFSARQHDGSSWFGFVDYTDTTVALFRIVRVKQGCRYRIYHEVLHPPTR